MPPAAQTKRREQSVDRAAIVSAALKLFRRQGYHATSMQDLAEEVGILKGSLYHHIASKEQLLVAVLEDYVSEVHARVREVVRSQLPARAKLRRIIMTELEVMAAHQDAITVWSAERGRMKTELAELETRTKAVDQMFRSVVRAGIKSGVWGGTNDRAACQAILGMLAYFPIWYHPGGELSVGEIGEWFATYADRILTNPGSRAE
jgi:AcrR family transcriptional regulator